MALDKNQFLKSGTVMSLNQDHVLIGYGDFTKKGCKEELDPLLPAFYFPDFFLKDKAPWIQYEQWQEMPLTELDNQLTLFPHLPSLNWDQPHTNIFLKIFESLQQSFKSGLLKKAVPYTFAYSYDRMNPPRLEHALKTSLSSIQFYQGYLYGHWNQHQGILGVTPELLFRYNQHNELETIALAGTSSKQICQATFKNDLKEQYEHQLVIQGIKHSLEQLGTVEVGECTILSLPHLNHLMTPIRVNLCRSVDFQSLIRSLHPTPALGTFPKEEGIRWLEHYDNQIKRDRYGAPVGYFYPQKQGLQCMVAIRNVQWDQTGMRIGAGCGIVPSSQLEKERKEIDLKINAIQRMFAL